MPGRNQHKNRIELLQGTLDMLILRTLQWGPQHGYGITQTLRINSGDVLQVETGSLYPALHRLERQGWVRSEWKQAESNQHAKYYRITAAGKKQQAADHRRLPLKAFYGRVADVHRKVRRTSSNGEILLATCASACFSDSIAVRSSIARPGSGSVGSCVTSPASARG